MRNFSNKIFSSLGKKVAAAVIAVFLIAGSLFVYFAQQTGYRMLERGAKAKAHNVVQFGRSLFEFMMSHERREDVQAALENAISFDQANDVLILKRDGKIAFGVKSTNPAEKLPIDQFVESSEYPGEKFAFLEEKGSAYEYIVAPIIKKPACFSCHTEPDTTQGFLAVKISMDDVRGVALQHRTINILMTIFIFTGLGLVLFITLLYVVVRPVKVFQKQIMEIETQIRRFEQGERVHFKELDIPRRRDEIVDVMKSFNNLLRRLNEANASLHELHQARLEQADRLATTGEIAASMAHEIKNPVAGILGALQVFYGETGGGDPRKEILAEMMVQTERVNQAVNDLLSYARPTPPAFERIPVNEVIVKSVTLLSQQIKGTGITIQTRSPDEPVLIKADPKQLRQVFWNIMLNGIQAMESSGVLTVSLTDRNSSVAVEISDTGKGIGAENLGKVFKPFFTTKHKGTGLGMTISRRIIEQHGGTIGIDSTPGKGTVITISLPKQIS